MTRNQKIAMALGVTSGFLATLITNQPGVIAVAAGVAAVIVQIFMVRGRKKQQEENPDQSQ